MDVATLKDVCDNVDPLCSPDDSCHILILHIQVSETPGDAGNLSENNTAAHPDLLNHTSTLLQAHDPCLHFQLHVILVCVSSSCVYPYYLVFTIAQFRKTACFITYLVCALTQPQKYTGLMSLMSNLDCSLQTSLKYRLSAILIGTQQGTSAGPLVKHTIMHMVELQTLS